jgi:3-oxoacyl-[acyl-carrier-protein] synthase-3
VATSDIAEPAARGAIAEAGLVPNDIDFIVVGTTTPDTIFPSTACTLQAKLGATGAWGFDLGAACSGFTYALTTAYQQVATGASEHALVVGADVMSSIIDYTDRATCVLFGDGAGAAVLSRRLRTSPRSSIFERHRWHRRPGALHAGRRQPAAGVHETVNERLHFVNRTARRCSSSRCA